MAINSYIGISGKARKIKNAYIGISGKARKIKKMYIGISGKARCIYSPTLTLTGLYSSVTRLAAASAGNYALFAGGFYGGPDRDVNTVNAYDTSLTRTTPTVLSSSRSLLAGATVGNYALFAGGGVGSNSTGSGASNVVDAYDTSLTRSTPATLFTARRNLAATSASIFVTSHNIDYALFGGGQNSSGAYVDDVDAYDGSLTRHHYQLCAKNAYMAAAYLRTSTGTSYAIFAGGAVANSNTTVFGSGFTMTTAMALGKTRLAATTVGNYALFAGGYAGTYSDTVYMFDKSSVGAILPSNLTDKKYALAATTVGNYALFAGGGQSGTTNYGSVDAYDTSLTKSVPKALSYARRNLAATTVGNYALFAGGGTSDSTGGANTRNNVDSYDTDLN